jgi:hypothetical protein
MRIRNPAANTETTATSFPSLSLSYVCVEGRGFALNQTTSGEDVVFFLYSCCMESPVSV